MSIGDGVVANGLAPRRLLFRQVDVFWRTHHRVTTPDILLHASRGAQRMLHLRAISR